MWVLGLLGALGTLLLLSLIFYIAIALLTDSDEASIFIAGMIFLFGLAISLMGVGWYGWWA
ncbi:Uncharacterised protein [uncultured archaeon]|nr:Uncharacterised protein [uncultured archaeon]